MKKDDLLLMRYSFWARMRPETFHQSLARMRPETFPQSLARTRLLELGSTYNSGRKDLNHFVAFFHSMFFSFVSLL